MINRRLLLKNGVLGAFGLSLGGAMPSFMANAVASPSLIVPYQRKKTLICIFQRGAMDGLAAVSPFSDADFKKARPSIYLSPASTEGQAFDLDGHFCLHPAMAALYPFFQEKRLAIVHGVGSPNNTRSHFDAQDYMESGTPFSKGTASGWLNRALDQTPVNASPFRALSMTSALPRSFYGNNEALAISKLEDFGLQTKGVQMGGMNTTGKSFEDLYDQTSSQLLNKTGKESFEAMKILKGADPKNYCRFNQLSFAP